MKPGDLVQVRSGLWFAGDIGMVVGPVIDGYLDVLFHDGIFATHPLTLCLVCGGEGVQPPDGHGITRPSGGGKNGSETATQHR